MGSASAEPPRRAAEVAPAELPYPISGATDGEHARRERLFADAQGLAHVGSWMRDLSAPRSVWSDELCRIFGQRPGFAPTYPEFEALVHPDDWENVHADLVRARTGELVDHAYRIVRPDGEVRYVHGRAYGYAETGGDITYVYGTVQDVTERHLSEAARRDAQELFETAFDQAPIGMALIGLDGRWMKVNAALCGITGWSEAELLERPFAEITHPDDVNSDAEQIRSLVAGESTGYQFEKRYQTRTGTHVWALLSVSLVRDAAGSPRHFIVQVVDINERKLAQSQLQEAEAEARAQRDHATAIVGAMGEGYALTMGGEIKAINDALCALTGFTAEQLIGVSPPYPFWPPEQYTTIGEVLADVQRNNGGDHEVILMRSDGERFEAEITVRPAREEDGRAIGFVSTMRDVSAQRRHQRELEHLASTDSLTQLANRHVLAQALDREAGRRSTDKRQLALVLLDIDLFKQVNDGFGHPAGDAVLVEVARRLERTVRAGEVLARVGGEEFAWLLPASNADEAIAAADRARQAIASEPFGAAGRLTMSAGVGLISTPSDGDALYQMADRALYEAKQRGRDCTCCHGGLQRGDGRLQRVV
jgi:diguanylate cyclase (GGDEF)-like protein/PAS domain S-box-containing protein